MVTSAKVMNSKQPMQLRLQHLKTANHHKQVLLQLMAAVRR